MTLDRIIPVLLLRKNGLYKSIRFSKHVYIGDPLNTVKIFNDKGVDEIVIFDIDASLQNKRPDFKLIEDIASECFMPMCYGGGIKSIDDMKRIFNSGVEKVSINSYALLNPSFIKEAASCFGSQSVVVTIDVRKNWLGKYVICCDRGKSVASRNLLETCKLFEDMGAGEMIVNSIDHDGQMAGYDMELIKMIANNVSIPVVACGGAGDISDCHKAIREGGVSAAAAGSLFIYSGKSRSVLINYPSEGRLL